MGLQPSPPSPSPMDRLQGLPSAASVSAVFKRKHARSSSDSDESPEEDNMDVDDYPPVTKKICIEVVKEASSEEVAADANNGKKTKQQLESAGEESDESHTTFEEASSEDEPASEDSDSEENTGSKITLKVKTGDFESILAKTLLNSKIESAEEKAAESCSSAVNDNANNNNVVVKAESESSSPKVIVEHQPLPSIYELQQNQADAPAGNNNGLDNDQYDSGLSDDSSDGGIEDDDDSEDDDEDLPMLNASPLYNSVLGGGNAGEKIATPQASPMLNAAKPIYQDRFWSQSAGGSPATPPPPAATPLSPFQFLDQGNQRIECAENGKSYMQLGTMTHQLPVTPVIQPKPINGGGYTAARRPLPPFRVTPQPARPVCDHSNCLQKKQSHCYRSTRGRMLNVSLHKLHLARQNHEGSLRRSVLICNMLRKIEDETEKEAVAENQAYLTHQQQMHHHHQQQQQQAAAAAAAAAAQQQAQQQHEQQQAQQQQQHLLHEQQTSPPHNMEVDQYWPSANNSGGSEMQHQPSNNVYSPSPSTSSSSTPPPVSTTPLPSYTDTYESTLKDFNTAFRVTTPFVPESSLEHEEDREINWGSVLSLSSQSELDPINNNWSASVSCTTSSATTAVSSAATTTVTTSSSCSQQQQQLDDIGWKLSAEDVLRAFPNDENIFVGP